MAPGSNEWVQKAPLFDGCDADSDGPEWIKRLPNQGAQIGDFDAKTKSSIPI